MPVSFFPARKESTARDYWATAAAVSLLQCTFDANDYRNSVVLSRPGIVQRCSYPFSLFERSQPLGITGPLPQLSHCYAALLTQKTTGIHCGLGFERTRKRQPWPAVPLFGSYHAGAQTPKALAGRRQLPMVRSNRRIVGIVELLSYNAVAWMPGYIGKILTTMAWRVGETSEARLQTDMKPGIEISSPEDCG
jgi:hypothetical protein